MKKFYFLLLLLPLLLTQCGEDPFRTTGDPVSIPNSDGTLNNGDDEQCVGLEGFLDCIKSKKNSGGGGDEDSDDDDKKCHCNRHGQGESTCRPTFCF